ncbi:MAG: hypothetical protein PHU04_02690 [Candidatus Peribacteraceae bacterium]|nr:hypothetical protein [Candidatus Peribacteraceae bacterium]
MARKLLPALLLTLAIPFLGFAAPLHAQQAEREVNVYFFWGEGCPHCEKEKPFLEGLQQRYPSVNVHDFEVWNSSENRSLFIQVGKALNADVGGVPFTVIGEQYFVGYLSDQTTGKNIEAAVADCAQSGCPDVVGTLLNPLAAQEEEQEEAPANEESEADLPDIAGPEQDARIRIHFFYTGGCPLCSEEKAFLQDIAATDEYVDVLSYDVGTDAYARELYGKALEALDTKATSLPLIAIGEQYFIGWNKDGTTRNAILEGIKCAQEDRCPDRIQQFLYSPISGPSYEKSDTEKESVLPDVLTLPFLGDVKTKNLSLPIFTLIVAGLDGFNPCAMWTLIFLIGLLLGMKDRKRMWILGTAFIMASAGVYFLFLSAWLNLLLFIGFILWVRLAIGLVALGGGGYYLKEFFLNPHGGCKVTGGERRQKVFARMKEITQNSHFALALGGIIILAVAVNLVELICSAGLPAVYTQVLTLSDLPMWQYYLYLLLYILIFMLDDLFIFFSAMITLQMTGLSDKYARVSHLIGGTLMLLIGLLLIFKPEWLMFG